MGPQPLVSASYLKGLLAARGKKNARSKTIKTTKRRRRSTKTSDGTATGGVTKRRYKRRKRRRRAAPVRAPLKKTAEISIQTSDYSVDESDFNVSVGTSTSRRTQAKPKESWSDFIDSLSSSKTKKKVKKEAELDKKSAILDVISLVSDDDEKEDFKPRLKKKPREILSDNGPSTSRGSGAQSKVPRRRALVLDSSDEEEDATFLLPVLAANKISPTKLPKNAPLSEEIPNVASNSGATSLLTSEQLSADSLAIVHDLLFAPPIAASIAKSLPMKSLNALSQVNPLLREICRQEKMRKRRQTFDWFLRPSIITALDGSRMQSEKRIFGGLISEVYCEPDLVMAFCSPRILYDYKMNFDAVRSPHQGRFKVLHDVIADLMPAGSNTDSNAAGSRKIVHIRTHGVMPPLPLASTKNSRKNDHYGNKESPRDLCLLFIPKIEGVNMWREYLTASDLRKQLRDSGWLENRSQNHFLLPVIKDLEALSPKLVIIFSRRLANYDHVASSEFPVIVLNTADEFVAARSLPDSEYGLEWLAFGGNVLAFQVCIKATADRQERSQRIRHLRDQFTASQVMGSRMLLFYFRNVTKFETENTTEQTELLERDIIQLREEFPRVPIFGGGYQNVIASCFTSTKTAPDFGKFFSGLHSAFVCGLVLGN